MLRARFATGGDEHTLQFSTSGRRSIGIEVPDGCVVRDASLAVELLPLTLSPLRRVGLARTCSLAEFHALEGFLERAERSRDSFLPGWRAAGTMSNGGAVMKSVTHVAGDDRSAERLDVIPLDPSEMADATPSFYRAEFDAVIVPYGEEEVRLEPLLASGVPLLTTSHEIAVRAGLADRSTLHAGLRSLRVLDREDFVTEMAPSEEIALGLSGGLALADAVAPSAGTKTLVDTGTTWQAVIVASLERKRIYFGIRDTRDLTTEPLAPMFTRAVEWCGVGGDGGQVSLKVGETALDLSGRRDAKFRGLGASLDAVLASLPAARGARTIPLDIEATAPCRVRISGLDVRLAYRSVLRRFVEGETVRVELDGVLADEATLDLPRDAKVRSASVKLRAELSDLRVATHRGGSRRTSGTALPGTAGASSVLLAPHHWIAQGFRIAEPATLKRVEFLAKAAEPAALEIELRAGDSEPGRTVLGRCELEAGDLPESASWVGADLEVPLDPRRTYWLVLRCLEGEVTVACERGDAPLLRYTKDAGGRWAAYDLDARHRILVESPRSGGRSLHVGGSVAWQGERDADLVRGLEAIIESQLKSAPGTARRVRVPLRFTTPRVGVVELYDLEVEYETGEEAAEGMEKVRTIAGMIEELRAEVSELGDKLGPKAKELRVLPGSPDFEE